ncbi:MAG TPA: hypothetical protein VEL76_20080 [Gemmataceae bacterium]|nr:hypothetical protein [Gemmataceae bacterium]
MKIYTVTADGKSFTINGFNKSEFTLALASDDRIVRQGGVATFHPSTTFAEQYAKGSLRVGTLSGSGNIWTVRGPLEDAWLSSWSRSAKPPRLPEDGKSVIIPAKELQPGGEALWLRFATGPREQLPSFLIVATLPAQETEKADKADKGDQQAKEAAEQFLKALLKPDLEAVMKTVDVPFCLQGRENIKDHERLKKLLESFLAPALAKWEYKAGAVAAFGSLPENIFSESEHKLFKEILTKTDCIVLFPLPRRATAIAVRVEETKARVVGIRFGLSPLTLAFVAEQKDKGDKRAVQAREIAKETVQNFLKAGKTKDLESIMKLVEVPWSNGGLRTIKDREELKKQFSNSLEQGRGMPGADIFLIARYGPIRELFAEPGRDFDQIVGKEDWVVFTRGEGKQKENVGMLFVRVREGEGKIIGAGR